MNESKPWYREFYVWVVLMPLIMTFIGSAAILYLGLSNPPNIAAPPAVHSTD